MPGQIQSLFTPATELSKTNIAGANVRPAVLVITADIRLFSAVLHAASSVDWQSDWARTMGRAIEICRLEPAPIVVFDDTLPGVEWGWAFDLIHAVSNRRRILLASRLIDEELWRKVVLRGGYDIVRRSAGSEEWKRLFRFAWLSLAPAA